MRSALFAPYADRLFCTITDRHGGVSPAPYDSLNLALHVGDNPENVLQNRIRLAQKHDYYAENLIYMEQTHSDRIAIIEDCAFNRIENCDAIVTDRRNIPLMVMVADCIPVMLYDPVRSVIAAVHAGRNGTFKAIAPKTIREMEEAFGSDPGDILALLGPSIHACCYEVGADLADITIRNFGKTYLREAEGKTYLDLQRLNLDQLLDAGLKRAHIEISPVCTCCDTDYFSYRREGTTGRFAGVIKLK